MTGIIIAAEGACNALAVRVIAESFGIAVYAQYDTGGKNRLDERLPAYLKAADHSYWLISRDLDQDAECAPQFVQQREIIVGPNCYLLIAVRSVEAWLLADRDNFSAFLSVPKSKLAASPEGLEHPKTHVAQLALTSRRGDVRRRMAGRPADGAAIGAEYGAAIYEFIRSHWDFRSAAASGRSPSLSRAFVRIEAMSQRLAAL